MAFTDIWVAAGVSWVIGKLIGISKEEKAKRERDLQRQATPCYFEDGITQVEFSELAYEIGKQIKRIKSVYVEHTVIHCTVESQTGYTTWDFNTDFNDWGHITGKYWSKSDNDDSKIPEHFNNMMANAIREKLAVHAHPERTFNGYHDSYNNTFSGTNSEADRQQHEYTKRKSDNRATSYSRKDVVAWVATFLLILSVLLVGMYTVYKIWENSRLIEISFGLEDVIGLSYIEVEDRLIEAGFTSVYSYAVEDLDVEDEALTETISEITINEESTFVYGDKFDCDAEIRIYYHELIMICVPVSSKEAKGEDYQMIVSQIEDAGFTNIQTEAIYDLTLGVLKKDGAVESISVNGDTDYMTTSTYRPDVEIIISYHTFKNNEPEE